MAAKIQSWAKLDSESAAEYTWFIRYRDLPIPRNMSALAREYHKARSHLEEMKSRNLWLSRCADWDAFCQAKADEDKLTEQQKLRRKHMEIALALQNKALTALRDVSMDEMRPKDIREWLELAIRIENDETARAAGDGKNGEDSEIRITITSPKPEEAEDDDGDGSGQSGIPAVS